ncbi:uncharacterized protein LOC111001571 [Pieris rapae]|uniref:uncharacterized protein LOC111001571 n=1 Tax=Pieris rapae TaxID=64459 RepID=UPI001E27FAB4|nr:uncharacterized protein LOC111001571 [Pieris rapae]
MKHNKGKFDENSYCMLLKNCKEKILCDFCDKTFDSRYSHIIHNAHHIVIPLLKQELHQCKDCLYHFQTVNDLVKHLLEKHNHVSALQQTVNKNIFNSPSTSISNKKLEIINISDDEDNTEGKGDILNCYKHLEKSPVEKKITKEETSTIKGSKSQIDSYINVKTESLCNTWKVAIDKRVIGFNLYDTRKDIENEEYILPDVYYNVKISPNIDSKLTKSQLTNTESISNCRSASGNNDGMLQLNTDSERCLSINYNELTQSCNYKCKYCQNVNMFPNRYALTLHQMSHLEIANIQPSLCLMCDKYFSCGNLKKHLKEVHSNVILKNSKLNACTICNFKYYSYKKHLYNYHHSLFSWESCPERITLSNMNKFHGNIAMKTIYHISGSNTDIVELCAKCFKKMTNSNIEHIKVSTCRKAGCQLKCSNCHDKFSEINFVEKWHPVYVSRFKFEEEVKKRRKKTNEDRLRNIQMRLKMINKLSRFYVWFYLFKKILKITSKPSKG